MSANGTFGNSQQVRLANSTESKVGLYRERASITISSATGTLYFFKDIDMFNLISEGLKVQQLIADANRVTDDEAHAIKAKGLRLVSRPDNVRSIREAQAKRDYFELLDVV